MPIYEKMSKSRGNVVLPEEVVYGVYQLDDNYEFRDLDNQVIDYTPLGVWRDKPRSGMFFTDTKHGRRPVFLHEKDNPVPVLLLIADKEQLQHPNEWVFWGRMILLHDTETI